MTREERKRRQISIVAYGLLKKHLVPLLSHVGKRRRRRRRGSKGKEESGGGGDRENNHQ